MGIGSNIPRPYNANSNGTHKKTSISTIFLYYNRVTI